MKLLPDDFSPKFEASEIIRRAAKFSENNYEELSLSVASDKAYIAAVRKENGVSVGELFVMSIGIAPEARKIIAGPFTFARGEVSSVICHYLSVPTIRVYYADGKDAKYVDFNFSTNTFSAPCDFKADCMPFDMNKTVNCENIMTVRTDNGAKILKLNDNCTAAEYEYSVPNACKACVCDDDDGGYIIRTKGAGKSQLIKSKDLINFEHFAPCENICGKPTFVRPSRIYYKAEKGNNGNLLFVSKDAKAWELMFDFEGYNIKDIYIYEWDCRMFFTALLDNKPIFGVFI